MPNSSLDPVTSFKTHAAYATAFSYLATGGCALDLSVNRGLTNTANLIRGWVAQPDKPVKDSVDLDAIHRSLRHAWGTELLQARNLEMKDDGLVRLANTWSIVQTYYVLYHSTQALWGAKGNERPNSHLATQGIFISLWVTRNLHLPPLTLGFGSNGVHNVPDSVNVPEVHQWRSCGPETCWPIASRSLRTTRTEAIENRKKKQRDEKTSKKAKAWDAEELERIKDSRPPRLRPKFVTSQLTAEENQSAEKGVRSYGLIDYLYRLRIRANYVDASLFTDGPEDDSESTELAVHLGVLSAVTLLGHEHRVSDLVGATQLTDWMDQFIEAHPAPSTSSVATRRNMYPLL